MTNCPKYSEFRQITRQMCLFCCKFHTVMSYQLVSSSPTCLSLGCVTSVEDIFTSVDAPCASMVSGGIFVDFSFCYCIVKNVFFGTVYDRQSPSNKDMIFWKLLKTVSVY